MCVNLQAMTRAERAANLIGVVVPFLGLIAAIVLLWQSWVDWVDLAIMAGLYLVYGAGITVGYHRLLTHKAFVTPRPVRHALAILGSMAVQGPVIDWVADHRKHHAFTDKEGDPHSPHGHESWWRGLLYAHMGWLLDTQGQARKHQFARDLVEDPTMRRINRLFPQIALAGLLIPFALGWAITGELAGGVTGFVWGGLVRVFFVHHITWSVNSVCHFFGTRRFATEDHSTNVVWLALPSLGESFHHNHHAFPKSAKHGLRWYEVDLSGVFIGLLERVGLAREVTRVEPEAERRRLAQQH